MRQKLLRHWRQKPCLKAASGFKPRAGPEPLCPSHLQTLGPRSKLVPHIERSILHCQITFLMSITATNLAVLFGSQGPGCKQRFEVVGSGSCFWNTTKADLRCWYRHLTQFIPVTDSCWVHDRGSFLSHAPKLNSL